MIHEIIRNVVAFRNTFKKILGILLIAVASVVMLIPADKASAAYTSVNFGKEYDEFIEKMKDNEESFIKEIDKLCN